MIRRITPPKTEVGISDFFKNPTVFLRTFARIRLTKRALKTIKKPQASKSQKFTNSSVEFVKRFIIILSFSLVKIVIVHVGENKPVKVLIAL